MEKLGLKHIAPYFPYGLKCLLFNNESGTPKYEYTGVLTTIKSDTSVKYTLTFDVKRNEDSKFTSPLVYDYSEVKPILRPLRDLYLKLSEHSDIMDQFSEYSWELFETSFFMLGRSLNCFDHVNYTVMQLLLEHYFDVFGLIEQGLAVDINTLEK